MLLPFCSNPGFRLQSTWWQETAQFLSASTLEAADTKSSFRLRCNLWYRLSYGLNRSGTGQRCSMLSTQSDGEAAFDMHTYCLQIWSHWVNETSLAVFSNHMLHYAEVSYYNVKICHVSVQCHSISGYAAETNEWLSTGLQTRDLRQSNNTHQ